MSRLPLAVEHALANAETTKARQAAARMEAIGELTAGVAHDFNNLLQAIISHLELVDDVPGIPWLHASMSATRSRSPNMAQS